MQPGSLVICVDDNNWRSDATRMLSSLPIEGHIYRVRAMIKSTRGPGEPDGVFLEGIVGKVNLYTNYYGKLDRCECHFRQSRFAELLPPISERVPEEIDSEEAECLDTCLTG